ncbi:unnamed protein product, partial [Cyprideis torosa]
MELTERQELFLAYLKEKIAEQGRAPSLREAARDFDVSHTAVSQLIQQLEKKGIVERDGHYSRTLRIRDGKKRRGESQGSGRQIPVVGRITAGLPMYAQEEWQGSVVVDADCFRGENLFCLRVMGDSMRGAGILDGDLVICEPRQYAENGEIVVGLIHGEEATVKRFYLLENAIEMRPENEAYPVM